MIPQQCEDKWGHLCALADFSIALNESIQEINKHSFNNFELRIGKQSTSVKIKMWFKLKRGTVAYPKLCAQFLCTKPFGFAQNLNFSSNLICPRGSISKLLLGVNCYPG